MEDKFYLWELLILDYMVNLDELVQEQDHSGNKLFPVRVLSFYPVKKQSKGLRSSQILKIYLRLLPRP